MQKKIFFFDYDGTLVHNTTKQIPESAMRALQELKKQGHILFVNTGRTKGIVDPEIYDWPFDGMILGCGTYITYHDEIWLDEAVDEKDHETIQNIMNKYHSEAFYEGKDCLYISDHIQHKDLINMITRYKENGITILPDTTEHKSFSKLFVCMPDISQKEAFVDEMGAYFTYINRGIDRCEFVPKGYSKATGIQFVCEKLGVDKEDCFVFGDSNNDMPMFEYISNSVLIGGENPELSKHVMYTSCEALEDGVEKALIALGFIKQECVK
ncbi:HAD-IIB family hydrolase [Absiella sp. AM29-15]|uniref:HAD-IIB family hydrolase n=1 Tax=Absiella sp. AM29-15 TaxID=2292278 RepID=UPI000E40D369|nr:HAD family hydrolase [Absiella sp. AM29-15]RGC53825.1 HAD family phosphatase [Absiella sp. AM29-15]